jgi:multidrug efflux pump subunit AcrA (membrane-fusion protein)
MYNNSLVFIKKYFRIILITFLLLAATGILITSFLTSTEPPITQPTEESDEKILEVETVQVGEYDSFASSIAKAENKNEITLKAINSGVIRDIDVKEGDEIKQDNKILETDENYNGENSIDLQIEIAESQLEKVKENENSIKNKYNDRKNLAEETYDDYLAMLELNRAKIVTIEKQIESTDDLRYELDKLIEDYEDFEDEIEDYFEDQDQDFLAEQGVLQNKSVINNMKTAYTQYENTLLDLEDQLALLKYQTGANYPGNEIEEINKDLTLNQLKLEQDLADIDVDIASLNLELLKLQKDLHVMRSPINGRIEKIYVKTGEAINPGQEIITISGKINMILKAYVTPDLINKIDNDKPAQITIENQTYSAKISFISTTALENGFFEVLLDPETKLEKLITPGSSVKIEFQLNIENINKEEADLIYIPIDTVFRTNTSSYVLIVENGIAIQRMIQAGEIVGDQVKIISGLNEGELLINDRRIVPNQKITVKGN